jgi:hypothetical protein
MGSKKEAAEEMPSLLELANMICAICKKKFSGYGNNAEPVAEGQCCDSCNKTKVVPARIKEIRKNKEADEEVLSANNVEKYIMKAFESYRKKNMLVDLFFWREAVRILCNKYGITEKFNAALKEESE